MEEETIIVKSERRRYFRIAFALIIAIIFYNIEPTGEFKERALIPGIICFFVLLELMMHTETVLELNSTELKVKKSNLYGIIIDEFSIKLYDIQTSHFEKITHDNFSLMRNFIWELYFPTNTSYLIVHKITGEPIQISIRTHEKEINKIVEKLPNRIPEF